MGGRPGASTFGAARRLRRRSDFVRVQSSSARVTTRHFVFLVARQPNPTSEARLGLVVTRKVGGAVARNRIKRVCRECFRTSTALLPAGIDLVVIARQGADALGLPEVRTEWSTVAALLRRRAAEALAQTPRELHVSGDAARTPRAARKIPPNSTE